jgi:hypothetical protein
MMLKQDRRKFEVGTFMKVVMVAVLFLLPATSSASDDVRELGKAAEKLARAYNVDDALNDFFFGALRGRSDPSSYASQSGGTSRSSGFKDKTKSKFTFKGLSKLEYKYGDMHRISMEESSISYRLTMALW